MNVKIVNQVKALKRHNNQRHYERYILREKLFIGKTKVKPDYAVVVPTVKMKY